jgi:hypothetical protein
MTLEKRRSTILREGFHLRQGPEVKAWVKENDTHVGGEDERGQSNAPAVLLCDGLSDELGTDPTKMGEKEDQQQARSETRWKRDPPTHRLYADSGRGGCSSSIGSLSGRTLFLSGIPMSVSDDAWTMLVYPSWRAASRKLYACEVLWVNMTWLGRRPAPGIAARWTRPANLVEGEVGESL